MGKVIFCFLVSLVMAASAADFKRTVVALVKPTIPGQYVFLRGGGLNGVKIPIKHSTVKPENTASFYSQTSEGDTRLEWYGKEEGQGDYTEDGRSIQASGTPMMWTTNNPNETQTVEKDGAGRTPLNYQGEHVWIADFEMDCDATDDGWFDVKGYTVDTRDGQGDEGWEKDYINQYSCYVDNVITRSKWWADRKNHHAKCGYFNFFMWSRNSCSANKMEHVLAYINQDKTESPTSPEQ